VLVCLIENVTNRRRCVDITSKACAERWKHSGISYTHSFPIRTAIGHKWFYTSQENKSEEK